MNITTHSQVSEDNNEAWKQLMLLPFDYNLEAVHNKATRKLMELIEFEHGVYCIVHSAGVAWCTCVEWSGVHCIACLACVNQNRRPVSHMCMHLAHTHRREGIR